MNIFAFDLLYLKNMQLKGFRTLLIHEFTLEFRQRFSFAAQVLYVAAVVFIFYLTFSEPDGQIWNSLFWMVMLFSGIQLGTTSFKREFGHSHLFYFQLIDPLMLFFSKIISVWVRLLILGISAWIIMSVVLGDPVVDKWLFGAAVFLGSLGLAVIFSFLSAISMSTENSGLLLAVLSFPVLLPVLLSVIRLSFISMAQVSVEYFDSFATLIAVVMLVIGMGIFLFPTLWKN